MITPTFLDSITFKAIQQKNNALEELKSDLEWIKDEIDGLEDELRKKEDTKWDLERKIKDFQKEIGDEDLSWHLPTRLSQKGYTLISYSYKSILPEKQLKLWDWDKTTEVKCRKTVLIDNELNPVTMWDNIPSLTALFEVMAQ